jgi:hypothetical protein
LSPGATPHLATWLAHFKNKQQEDATVASILYNGHLIVPYPVFDEATKTWKPKIQLTLALDKTQSFPTKALAECAGLNAAKSMIDSLTLTLAH